MAILYRVLPLTTWQQARAAGRVPRCGNDHKADGVNLSLAEAIEYTARRYFTADEQPVVLTVDTSGFSQRIEWREPLANEPWLRPLARIPGLPVASVVEVTPVDTSILEK